MKTVKKILFFSLVVFFTCTNQVKTGEISLEYFGNIERSLRYKVFNELQQFKLKFREEDSSKIFDHDFNPAGIQDVDVLIFFVDHWEQIQRFDSDWDFLKPIFKSKDDNEYLHVEELSIPKVEGGSRKGLAVFYSTAFIKDKPVSCFAKNIINILTANEKQNERKKLIDCY